MRSREEIDGKITELLENAAGLRKEIHKAYLIAAVFFILFCLFIILSAVFFQTINETDTEGLVFFVNCYLFFASLISACISVFGQQKTRRTMHKRVAIANSLREVRRILKRPDGDKIFYAILDGIIIKRNKKKKEIIKPSETIEHIREDARVEAFTWVASPDLSRE